MYLLGGALCDALLLVLFTESTDSIPDGILIYGPFLLRYKRVCPLRKAWPDVNSLDSWNTDGRNGGGHVLTQIATLQKRRDSGTSELQPHGQNSSLQTLHATSAARLLRPALQQLIPSPLVTIKIQV